MWRPSEPSLSIASKGLVALDVVVTGADRDLHSGRYGGTVANPVHALAAVVACLHAADGAVAVAGFYDGVAELTAERRAEIDAVAVRRGGATARGLGVPELARRGRATARWQRLWERPTLEVNGITGRRQVHRHPAPRGRPRLLPAGRRAGPGRRGRRRSPTHVPSQRLPGVRGRGAPRRGPGAGLHDRPPSTRRSGRRRAALEEVYPGQEVLLAVIAGTLPATTLFEDVLGAKTLFFSFATADESTTRRTSSCASAGSARACAPGGAVAALADGPQPARRGGGGRAMTRATAPTTTWPATSACRSSPLAPESGRVPPLRRRASPPEHGRAGRAAAAPSTITISLHDHPVLFPADMADTPRYNRTGRQHTAFAGLRASGMTVVFDNMMDGTACVTGNAPWQWDDVVTDLGMRLADLAHQSDVVVIRTLADIHARARRRPGRAGLRPGGGHADRQRPRQARRPLRPRHPADRHRLLRRQRARARA